MWPTLLKIGNFEITTFGLMMFLAFLAAGYVLTKQFRRYSLDDDTASTVVLASAIGGIVGAKIYYAILYHDIRLVLSRAGLVWYGGFIGGVLACWIVVKMKRISWLTTCDAAAPALAVGYAIGRIGCFLVGDDYGRPTTGWWGIAFPKGAPPTTAESLREFGVHVDPTLAPDTLLRVHPTQIYESVAGFVMFAILLRASRKAHRPGSVFALFLILAGIERFLIEIVRAKDDRFLGPFTVAQLFSVLLVIAGIVMMRVRRGTPRVDAA